MEILTYIGDLFNYVIGRPLGWILYWCYFVTKNYGLALLVFTLVTRVLLLPLSLKQQRSMAEMQRLQPKIKALQNKYGKDQKKLQEAQMKLYSEEGYNPFNGCLPLLIQLPIFYGLFQVIYRPFTYILGMSADTIQAMVLALKDQIISMTATTFTGDTSINAMMSNSSIQIYLAGAMQGNMDKLSGIIPPDTMIMDFNLFGLDLTHIPTWDSVYVLIPILCYVFALVSQWITMKFLQPNAMDVQTKNTNRTMLIIMPLVSLWFAFSLPSGIGYYWICTNIILILQTLLIAKFYNPKKLAVKLEAQAEERKAKLRAKYEKEHGIMPEEPDNAGVEQVGGTEEAKAPIKNKPSEYSSSGKKKTKKQLMEENRRRLSQARAREQKNKNKDK